MSANGVSVPDSAIPVKEAKELTADAGGVDYNDVVKAQADGATNV